MKDKRKLYMYEIPLKRSEQHHNSVYGWIDVEYQTILARNQKDAKFLLRKNLGVRRLPNGTRKVEKKKFRMKKKRFPRK